MPNAVAKPAVDVEIKSLMYFGLLLIIDRAFQGLTAPRASPEITYQENTLLHV